MPLKSNKDESKDAESSNSLSDSPNNQIQRNISFSSISKSKWESNKSKLPPILQRNHIYHFSDEEPDFIDEENKSSLVEEHNEDK